MADREQARSGRRTDRRAGGRAEGRTGRRTEKQTSTQTGKKRRAKQNEGARGGRSGPRSAPGAQAPFEGWSALQEVSRVEEGARIYDVPPESLPRRMWIAPDGTIHPLGMGGLQFHFHWALEHADLVRESLGLARGEELPSSFEVRGPGSLFDEMFRRGWVRVSVPQYETYAEHRGKVDYIARGLGPEHEIQLLLHSDGGLEPAVTYLRGEEETAAPSEGRGEE